jgi:NAD(P)-dependent dehydrogenase (short-subunit alcohol dehydrogenase family)
MRFKSKVMIITGAVQGIGRACALRMASEGATVVCMDRQADTGTADEINGKGGTARHHTEDVRSADAWTRVVNDTLQRYGKIDALGNVAGVVNMKSEDTIVGLTEEGWDYVIDTDLKGVWLGMRAVIPSMIKNGGGRIVNISSLAALRGLTNLASYSAAKGGVISLTQQAALDYAPQNVLINAIAPGTIDTPILKDITEEMRKVNANAHLLKRLGKPEEIAGTMAHFFSDDGSFLTGVCYAVDGGWSASGRNF